MKGQFEIASHYYDDNKNEIDFLIQYGTKIIPVEVKAGDDKSALSFKLYIKNMKPEIAMRFSKMGYRKDGEISNIPLYLAAKVKELL